MIDQCKAHILKTKTNNKRYHTQIDTWSTAIILDAFWIENQ
jgi:hypothetical protein